MSIDHAAIHDIVTKHGYGKGVPNNPLAVQCKEWERRAKHAADCQRITEKIVSLFEPRFITPPETSEFIAALVTMTDARKVLELGTCTAFTTYHILRALLGKENAELVTVDARPAHDPEFFKEFPILRHIAGWTPDCLEELRGKKLFDLVFVDSDHTLEHSQKEFEMLLHLTRPGSLFLFHDVPEWQSPQNDNPPPVRTWLLGQVTAGRLRGTIFPTCEQADCLSEWGPGYPKQCNPHLGAFIRVF